MNIIEAVLLGFVQGATEFLPVSSSGHLVLTQQFLGWQNPDLTFDVWLHFSTLLVVVIFFWSDFFKLTKKEFAMIFIASLPAAVVGIFFSDFIEGLFSSTKLVAFALLVTGLFNITNGFILRRNDSLEKKGLMDLNFKNSLVIGLFQALAITPGISRSGSTVFAGILQGVDRIKSFKFSFIISIPAILGASLLQLIKVSDQGLNQLISSPYILGAVAAFTTGLLSLYIFQFIIKKARLDWFGYYCLLLSGSYLIFF